MLNLSCPILRAFTYSFQAELILFNILPYNGVHLSWMLRARGFSLTYETSRFVNANYGYNIAPISMDIIVHEFFHLRSLFRVFISDVLALSATSVTSSAQIPVYYEPLSDTHRDRLFCKDSCLCSEFLIYLQQSLSDPRWDLSHLLTDHFAHRCLVKVSQLVQLPELFNYSSFFPRHRFFLISRLVHFIPGLLSCSLIGSYAQCR